MSGVLPLRGSLSLRIALANNQITPAGGDEPSHSEPAHPQNCIACEDMSQGHYCHERSLTRDDSTANRPKSRTSGVSVERSGDACKLSPAVKLFSSAATQRLPSSCTGCREASIVPGQPGIHVLGESSTVVRTTTSVAAISLGATLL